VILVRPLPRLGSQVEDGCFELLIKFIDPAEGGAKVTFARFCPSIFASVPKVLVRRKITQFYAVA
jgi:hypothetical protein